MYVWGDLIFVKNLRTQCTNGPLGKFNYVSNSPCSKAVEIVFWGILRISCSLSLLKIFIFKTRIFFFYKIKFGLGGGGDGCWVGGGGGGGV